MGAITLKINGLVPMQKRLQALERKVAKKAARDAVRAGANVLLQEAKARVPVYVQRSADDPLQPRLLKRSLGIKVKSYRKGTVVAIMGPRSGFKTTKVQGQRQRTATKFVRSIVRGGQTVYQNPTQYAHLAGPGRRQTFMDEAIAAGSHKAAEVVRASLEAAIAIAGGAIE
jgi:HK97 gp10 family phage protein